ncbi:MAG: hypothetical protein ACU0CI_11965 [Shimia sp.]
MAPELKVYIGYDSREDIAYQVCRHSLRRHATGAVSVHPLRQPTLRELGLYAREPDKNASTEFSLTRFLTPYLAAYDGWSLFVDCDFVFTKDVTALLPTLDPTKAAYVVQHDYTPAQDIKMDGKVQTSYPRKNWSSFILFNGAHPAVKALTPDIVNGESPAYLHRLTWAEDADIGALDLEWNFLVGEYETPSELPAALHYTNGGPWFEGVTSDLDHVWLDERALLEA